MTPLPEMPVAGRQEKVGTLPKWISPSSLKDYLGCSLRYRFRKILRLPSPLSPGLHLGKAVHAGLQAYHLTVQRGEDISAGKVAELYRRNFSLLEEKEPVEYRDRQQREETLATGERVVRAYLASEVGACLGAPEGVEVHLEERIAPLELPLTGIIDLLRMGNVPVDFKTVASTPGDLDLESFLHEVQLTAYALLLEAKTGRPVPGMEVVYLVKTKTPKVIRHRLPAPTPLQKKRFFALAGAFTEGLHAERFVPQPGMHCGWCPYRAECREWSGGGR